MEQTSAANMNTSTLELLKGSDLDNSLQNLRGQNIDDDGPVSAENLVMNIQESFSNSLQNLSLFSAGESGLLTRVPLSTYVGSASSGDKTYDSGETKKNPAPVVRDRRGSYKRRTQASWVKIVDTTEDGYIWRKYGQKEILHAKFPRCYYRCTHKFDQGCKASKQVDKKLENGSHMYHITYSGHHTCKEIQKNELMISDSGALSFGHLNFEDSRTNHLPTGPSSIRNIHNTASEQEVNSGAQSIELIASSYFGQSTIALWNDVSENGSSVNDLTFSESSCCRFDY